MKTYLAHKDGEILYSCTINDATADYTRSTGVILEEHSGHPNDVYIYGGVIRYRLHMPVELHGHTLINVRPNSTIHINQKSYPCEEGGDVELEFDLPGTYSIRVVRWPYLDKEFTIEN